MDETDLTPTPEAIEPMPQAANVVEKTFAGVFIGITALPAAIAVIAGFNTSLNLDTFLVLMVCSIAVLLAGTAMAREIVRDGFFRSTVSKKQRKTPEARLKQRLEEVDSAFGKVADVMRELNYELAVQEKARRKAAEEVAEKRLWLETNGAEAERVGTIIFRYTRRQNRRQLLQAWSFFTAGLIVSIPIGLFVNFMSLSRHRRGGTG